MTLNKGLQSLLDRHANLAEYAERYPSQAKSLCQTLLDVSYASKWTLLDLIDMQAVERQGDKQAESEVQSGSRDLNDDKMALIYGLRPEAKGLEAIWCCSIADAIQMGQFRFIFDCLDAMDVQSKDEHGRSWPLLKDHFLLAIHSTDATVVYYNIARGLVKPVN